MYLIIVEGHILGRTIRSLSNRLSGWGATNRIMHVSENGATINIPPMGGVILEGKRRLSSSVIQKMQTREINTGGTDAPNGVTLRPTDDMAVIGGDPAGSNEGEEHRITLLLSWKTTPADFLTVGRIEIQDAVLEEAKQGV